MRRSSLPAFLLLAALAACRPAEEPAPETPALSAPPKAVLSPLPPSTSGFTNDAQASLLREEAEGLGIERLGGPDRPEDRPMIGREEGIARTRAMARSIQSQRRALESGRPRSVQLPGGTPGLLSAPPSGGPEGPQTP